MIERVISRLKEKRDEFALESLRKPREKTSYDYGRACGVVEGFDKAEAIVTEILKDLIDEEDNK